MVIIIKPEPGIELATYHFGKEFALWIGPNSPSVRFTGPRLQVAISQACIDYGTMQASLISRGLLASLL